MNTVHSGSPNAVEARRFDPAQAAPLLDARLVVDHGTFRLDLPLTVGAGEVVALLGPNGAGKSTALRALAGLRPLDAGHLTVAGQRWDDPTAGRFVAPERRAAALVFQDYLLFPHLSVLDNVAFGLRCRGLRRRAARTEAAGWLARLDLTGYADRCPGQLSGGQAQRVALARALAVRPTLLLLDEPLAALDARTRLDTRAGLHDHLAAHVGATLLVTHDPVDAMVLADRVLVIEEGRVVQHGTPASVAARPRTGYVARLVGLNLVRGRTTGDRVRLTDQVSLPVAGSPAGEVFAAFPPSAVKLSPEPVGDGWPVTVTGVERYGDSLRVRLDRPAGVVADVAPGRIAELGLRVGRELTASVEPGEVRAYAVDQSDAPPAGCGGRGTRTG